MNKAESGSLELSYIFLDSNWPAGRVRVKLIMTQAFSIAAVYTCTQSLDSIESKGAGGGSLFSAKLVFKIEGSALLVLLY